MTILLGITPGAQAATPDTTSTSGAASASDTGDLVLMSEKDYNAYVASSAGEREKMLASNSAGESRYSPMDDRGNDIYSIIGGNKDTEGVTNYLRRGTATDGGFGYNHYAKKHNLTSTKVVLTALKDSPEVSGARREYDAIIFNNKTMAAKQIIHVIVQAATRSDDGKWKTNDGKYLGVITAYCKGRTLCPNDVNKF